MHPARLLSVAPHASGQLPPAPVAGTAADDRPDIPTATGNTPPDTAPLAPTPPRRERPWLLVAMDVAPASHAALVWALREAARREATVVAVSVCDESAADDDPAADWPGAAHGALLAELEARVQAATAEAGVRPRVRTAVLDAQVFEALTGAARGADLVIVGPHGKTLLRPAVARIPARRFARPA